MTKSEIIDKLQTEFTELDNLINKLSVDQLFQKPSRKAWSVAENIHHLFLAAKPLVGLFGKPEIMLSNWGKSTRVSKGYDSVIELYLKHIGIPGFSTKDFTPLKMDLTKTDLLRNFHSINENLLKKVASLSENDLDNYQIPHPLIGLMTCREFLYFTHYHTVHHHKTIIRILEVN